MTTTIDYIAAAKKTSGGGGLPKYPDPGNQYQKQLVNLQTGQASFDESWGEAKRLYREFVAKNDHMGMLTGETRLALLLTKAQEENWLVDGQKPPFFS